MNNRYLANPFTIQGRITDPGQFIGRRAEIDQITNSLCTMQAVSVVGERRIGKSSLLYNIVQTGARRLGNEVTIAYTDFPGVKDEASFYERCCRALHEANGRIDLDHRKPTGDYRVRDLENAVRGRRIVLCFDEFERVLRSPVFQRDFFDTLRSLAQSGKLAMLIATGHSLADLALDDHIATSPFFNIFRRVDLGLFTPEDAEAFICTRFNSAGVVITREEIERTLRLAGRYPFYLQLACYQLFKMKLDQTGGWEPAFKRDAADHLRDLWKRLKPSEQAAIRSVIDRSLINANESLLEELELRGVLIRDDQAHSGWSCFGEVFDQFVVNPPSRPMRDRIGRFRLPWLESVEISLGWPPTIKFTGRRSGGKQ
jgi:AAA+ ATPase superfamily predicted ATPase